jgi:AcrR family transcriptional regulator
MRHKKDATIQAIMDAAVALLYDKNGSAPHDREIAAKSGYSVGTIYNYFNSVGDVV